MDEQKQKEETTEEQKTPVEDNANGNESQTTPIIESANKAALELKTENDRREKLLQREEQLEARRTLGGMSEGKGPEEEKKELTPKEYADMVSKGIVPKE